MNRRRMYSASRMLRIVCAASFAAMAPPAVAKPFCSFASAAPVDFGIYSVFATQPNNFGVGSIQVNCQGGGGPINITLSTGQSHSFAARQMRSGASTLLYNLYISAARSAVWGDGSGASSAVYLDKNSNTKLDIFGQIPARQDVAVGNYSDHITAIVNF
ncbi:MAG: hypothetical protein CFE44_09900 [Burkholderiales bacterium PBB4]|nr:MAG: hypothetical protein CFE44_09900 [Burkholderiales bacterium PBB4]